jgi:hypothetical protein
MTSLATIRHAPLVRTDFSHPDEWARLSLAATAPTSEGYQAWVEFVDDADNDGSNWHDIVAALPRLPVAFVADLTSMTQPGFPILVIDSWEETPREPFRCLASELWMIECNLTLFNMDWEDFSDCCHIDGVFRGDFVPTHLR